MLGGALYFVSLNADATLVQCLQAAGVCTPSSLTVVANADSSSAKAARNVCVCVCQGEREDMCLI